MEALLRFQQLQKVLVILEEESSTEGSKDLGSSEADRQLAETLICLMNRFGPEYETRVQQLISRGPQLTPTVFQRAAGTIQKPFSASKPAKNDHPSPPKAPAIPSTSAQPASTAPTSPSPTAILIRTTPTSPPSLNPTSTSSPLAPLYPAKWLHALQRAKSTLQDFIESYYMFHGLDACNPTHVFEHLPILVFTEAYIYLLDHVNEETLSSGGFNSDDKTSQGMRQFAPLTDCLAKEGLLSPRLLQELQHGDEYWNLEHKLCRAAERGEDVDESDVRRAIGLKSFDYRVMNLLMYGMRGEPVDECHMSFMSASELLVEVSDDLYDYEEDVAANVFNVYRLMINIHGGQAAPIELAKWIREAEDDYKCQLSLLSPDLASQYQQRCQEATRAGGWVNLDGTCPDGNWNIPAPIEDESAFRARANG